MVLCVHLSALLLHAELRGPGYKALESAPPNSLLLEVSPALCRTEAVRVIKGGQGPPVSPAVRSPFGPSFLRVSSPPGHGFHLSVGRVRTGAAASPHNDVPRPVGPSVALGYFTCPRDLSRRVLSGLTEGRRRLIQDPQ